MAKWTATHGSNCGTLRDKLQEEFLSCKICLEPIRRPKALPCLHSFCEHCLRDYVRRHPGGRPGYFPCPMCRKETLIPQGGVEDFQDNFLLLSLSDTLDEDNWEPPGVARLNHQMSPPRHLCPPSPREAHLRSYE